MVHNGTIMICVCKWLLRLYIIVRVCTVLNWKRIWWSGSYKTYIHTHTYMHIHIHTYIKDITECFDYNFPCRKPDYDRQQHICMELAAEVIRTVPVCRYGQEDAIYDVSAYGWWVKLTEPPFNSLLHICNSWIPSFKNADPQHSHLSQTQWLYYFKSSY